MFGSKKAKQARLHHMQAILRQREVRQAELARELGVSRYTVTDDLATLERNGVKVCEHKGKLSLLEKWFKR